MKDEVSNKPAGNSAREQLALLEKQEEIREKRKREEQEREAKIASINKVLNAEQSRDLATLEASKIDFAGDPDAAAKAEILLAKLPKLGKSIPGIYYNASTGIGFVNDNRFRLKDDQPDFRVFAELYEHINQTTKRQRVLELAEYKGKSETMPLEIKNNPKRKPASATSETYFINELVKKMRDRTGLNADQLSNNNGNLTLVGTRLAKPPQ